MSFDWPWALLLLPLAALPLLPRWQAREPALDNSWALQLPPDAASRALQWALRAAAVLALAGLVLGIAGPYAPEVPIERVGRGAEIVLVLDRSRSMDESFAGARRPPPARSTGPEALAYYSTLRAAEARESKGQVARRLLAEFTARRPQDRFGLVVFSTLPMKVLDFTQKQPVIEAAIHAGNVGRGLAETHIGLALEAALGFFDDRPYTGSRILMLVSDGGDRLDVDMRERIALLARKHRVGLYWLYIRSPRSAGLTAATGDNPDAADAVPEAFLHRYFESLGLPYRAYEADNADALQAAIADVGRLENLPISTWDTLPRRDLAPWAYGTALGAVLLLLVASLAQMRRPA